MHRHLVAVKVSVKRGADQRMNLDRLALHKDRLERLNSQTVQRGRAIQEHRMIPDDFLKNVPYDRLLTLNHFLGRLDGGALSRLLKAMVDEGLEELEGHLLRQAALVKLQFGPDDNDRPPGIIHTLAKQVLAEPPLLAFERIRERFQRSVVGAPEDAPAAAVVEKR